jgi:hypothetical protein
MFDFARCSVISCMRETASGVRVEWAVAVTTRCQFAVTDLRGIDTRSFMRRFERLADDLPPAEGEAERMFLYNLLRTFADVGGRHYHDGFHRRVRNQPCQARALTDGMSVWTNGATGDPRLTLREWARTFETAFDKEHAWTPASPPRADLRPALDLDALATALGCRRVELTRTFRRGFGMDRARSSWFDVASTTRVLGCDEPERRERAEGAGHRVDQHDREVAASDFGRIVH